MPEENIGQGKIEEIAITNEARRKELQAASDAVRDIASGKNAQGKLPNPNSTQRKISHHGRKH